MDNFNVYAIYDTVGNVFRSDLTARERKYYDRKSFAEKALDKYLKRTGFDPDRFKVVEINCIPETTEYILHHVDLFEAVYECTSCGYKEVEVAKNPNWNYCRGCGRKLIKHPQSKGEKI